MSDPAQLALMHADIDGELNVHQKAELARLLLEEPQARAERERLGRLCQALDSIEMVEPPAGLHSSILAALPQTPISPVGRRVFASGWRFAAAVAGALIAGVLVFETTRVPRLRGSDAVGTMAAHEVTLDSVQLDHGPVKGVVRLYREGSGLALELSVSASAPLEALVAGGDRTLRVKDLGSRREVPLAGFSRDTREVEVSFLIDGHRVSGATLRAGAP